MKIMTDMLLSRFLMMHPDCKASEITKNIKTEGIRLLPVNPTSITSGYTYVCKDLDFHLLHKLPEQVVIVYFTQEVPTQNLPDAVIHIQSNMELADAFNALHTCFDEFIDWARQLDFAIFRNTDFQELITLSEQMLLTPVLVYDPALKLLAASQKYTAPDDPIFTNAVKNGFLDMNSVKYFSKSHIFDEMAVSGSVIRESDEFRMHADFAKAINIDNELAVYCVILYQDNLPRNYLNGVFSILCESLETLLKQQHRDFLKNRSVTDYFLMDLLDNPDTPVDQIKERLHYNDLDFDGYFLTLSIHHGFSQKPADRTIQMLPPILACTATM
jgi:hypothetical protein